MTSSETLPQAPGKAPKASKSGPGNPKLAKTQAIKLCIAVFGCLFSISCIVMLKYRADAQGFTFNSEWMKLCALTAFIISVTLALVYYTLSTWRSS